LVATCELLLPKTIAAVSMALLLPKAVNADNKSALV